MRATLCCRNRRANGLLNLSDGQLFKIPYYQDITIVGGQRLRRVSQFAPQASLSRLPIQRSTSSSLYGSKFNAFLPSRRHSWRTMLNIHPENATSARTDENLRATMSSTSCTACPRLKLDNCVARTIGCPVGIVFKDASVRRQGRPCAPLLSLPAFVRRVPHQRLACCLASLRPTSAYAGPQPAWKPQCR